MVVTTGAPSRVERFSFTSFDKDEAKPAGAPASPAEKPQSSQQQATQPALQEAALPPPPPAPTFSEEQMEQAKNAAFESGKQAGVQEADEKRHKAAGDHEASLRVMLDSIAKRITMASEDHVKFIRSQQDIMLKTTMAIARKIAGDALKREPHTAVETLLKDCMGLIAGQDNITIYVAPQKYEVLKQSINEIASRLPDFTGKIAVEGDDALNENDCRVEWKNGQAVRNTEALWSELESLLRKTILNN